MADATVSELMNLDIVFPHKLRAYFKLIRRRSPRRVVDLILWPQILRRIAVAIEAPRHKEWLLFGHHRLVGNVAMARRTAHTLRHMDPVVEIDEVGNLINPVPLHRNVVLPAVANWLQAGAVNGNLRVTTHTGLGGGDCSARSLLNRVVTILTLHLEAADMELVAIRNRLRNRHSGFVGEPIQIDQNTKNRNHQQDDSGDSRPYEQVAPGPEDLRLRQRELPFLGAICSNDTELVRHEEGEVSHPCYYIHDLNLCQTALYSVKSAIIKD